MELLSVVGGPCNGLLQSKQVRLDDERVHLCKEETRGLQGCQVKVHREDWGDMLYVNNEATQADSHGINTVLSSLQTCTEQHDLHAGCRIHALIIKGGLFETDIFIGNTLVNMYTTCGALTKGQELFVDLPVRNVVSWTALIAGYTRYGHGKEALHCFVQMQEEGFSPDAVSFACILKSCRGIEALKNGQEIHAHILRDGVWKDHILVGTALVGMYAKCGLLEKSQAVFDEFPVRSVVLWNALLTGYTQQGQCEKALEGFDQMLEEGFYPDVVTLSCILKACGALGTLGKGLEIHALIVTDGFVEGDNVVGTGLVDMYAKCGLFEEAHDVFNDLLACSVASWNALIAGYAQLGYGEEAWVCFKSMQRGGISPDAVTFACILKACGILEASEQGKQIHAEVLKSGFLEEDIVLATALVDMYAKCGLLEEAEEMFGKLPYPNIVSWNSLLVGYARYGHYEEVLDSLRHIERGGLAPSSVTFNCILKACTKMEELDVAEDIHARVVKEGLLQHDMVVSNALLDMYVKSGALAKAQQMFDELWVPDEISWTLLINGYAQHGHNRQAQSCLEHMVGDGLSLDATMYVCVLKACGSISALQKGQEIHARIVKDEMQEADVDIANALVDMYAKCGLLWKAKQVFDELPDRNEASWNALIAGYSQHGHDEQALQCYEQMQCLGLSPDASTIACLFKACGSTGSLEEGQVLHGRVVREGLLEEDTILASELVEMYIKCGAVLEALKVFDEIPVLNVVLWTKLMAGYVQHGCAEEALHCYEQMQLEGFSPDAVSLLCILKACGMSGAICQGYALHIKVAKDGLLGEDVFVASAFVDMYMKCGRPAEAQDMFDELPNHDVGLWNALVAGYAQFGKDEVADMLETMVRDGKEPDAITITTFLNAFSHGGWLDKGQSFFKSIRAGYGILPSLEHHTCMVDLFSRAGLLDEAVAVVKEMAFSASLTVWHIIMSACQKWGNREVGQRAFEEAFCLNKRSAAAFVCVGNLLVGDYEED